MEPARKIVSVDPPPGGVGAMPDSVPERREHGLLSLIELSKELSVSLDFYGIADLALFNLMGQMCTSRAAIWIVPPDPNRPVVLLRSYGMRKQWARALGTACGASLSQHMQAAERPLLLQDLDGVLGPAGMKLAEQAGIALVVPIHARGKLFALIALGARVDERRFTEVELQILQISLGMIGVALENTGLYNRLQEKHRQLRVANENLKELDRLKSEFLRNVNHELRTPLTIIIAYVNFLLEQEEGEGSQRKEFLDTINEESMKLKALLEKILDFSAISRDKLDFHLEAGDPEELLRSFHRDRLPGIAESLHEFSLEIGEDVPLARLDPHRLRQILDILVDNAVKFTPPGSNITLRLGRFEEESRVWARIDVIDDGPGLETDRLPQIFDSFRQGDGSVTREVGGLGMGLAFAKELADNMGARLLVESQIGQGAKFTILLTTN
jgi:signal transduction histidine kinase